MKRDIKNLYFLTGIFLSLASCQFITNKAPFRLNPTSNKIYKYTLFRTSERHNTYPDSDTLQHFTDKNNIDTFKLNFSLENILTADSLITYKLTFIDFFKNKKAKVIFIFNGDQQPLFPKDPFGLYDSLGYFIRGKSVEVVTNRKGVVKKVLGGDELMKSIADASHENEGHVRSLTSDFLSHNALKDLLNTFLSAVPGVKVKEGDRWVKKVMLVTKAPVKHSNLYALEQYGRDTTFVSIQTVISAEQSESGSVYMKGKGKGIVMLNYATGMPYLYETRSETETHTTEKRYEYISTEHFLVKEYE